ncbi:MAG: PEP-CTERM sorting domain-containing protein [Alphaproteobacteria bacterium]
MSKSATFLVLTGLALVGSSVPSFATTGVPIPEPTTLGLIAAGIAAGIVGYRLRKRK